MYLKKLQLNGFKSFADKTTFKFEQGITAIVGPNGCGKSNIADAIQWALGEQSSRALRVNRLEDLVFNGSRSRKSQGYAQVSLTIENPECKDRDKKEEEEASEEVHFGGNGFSVPTSITLKNGKGNPVVISETSPDSGIALRNLKDLPEITVTRRYYRSGESEYYINKQPVRLKDIVDLFLDTGLGGNAYSLIERDKVNLVLTSKPEDRRFLFEEAAGIMKYRVRKIEAMRKLEDTQTNLLRVNDIIQEVKRSINAIRRQVSKAERYRRYRQQLKELEAKLLIADLCRIKKERDAIKEELEACRQNEEKFKKDFSIAEAEVERLREELLQKEKELRERREKHYEAVSSKERANSQIFILEERKRNLSQRESEIKEELERIEKRTGLIDEEIRQAEVEMKAIEGEIVKSRANIQTLESELKKTELELKEAESMEKDSICLCCTVCVWREDRDKNGCFLEGKRFREIEKIGEGISGPVKSIHENIKKLEQKKEELLKKLNEERLNLALLEERLQVRQNEQARQQESKKELLHMLEEWKKEMSEIPRASENLESQLEEVKAQIEKILKQDRKEREELLRYEEAYSRARDVLMNEEERLKEMRRARGNEERLKELEIKEIEFKLQTENILQKLKEMGQSPESLETPDNEPSEIISREEIERETGILRQKIESMGEVNLVATEEYQRLKDRYLFLKKQTEDLTRSEEHLKKVIEEIEKTCRTRFMEAFNKIKKNFEDIFERLFEGGEASLCLTNPEDPLETGIEIVVQPPGKKLQSILLLSEGEQTLTAIALLFAIFLVKPSPFCFLDEIDAPLDDANILRFTKLLKEFSSISQFIVITHNKRTMEAANILYGITMEEEGVSKVVSVKMGEPVPA